MHLRQLQSELGNIDLYLLDAILKGYFESHFTILDAGCGEGRNAHWFIKNNFSVYGIDQNPLAIQYVRTVAKSLNSDYDVHRFQEGNILDIKFADHAFDFVVCSAVLHFASSSEEYLQMWRQLWRVLKPGGYLFVRTASVHGLEDLMTPQGNGLHQFPEGTSWHLLTNDLIAQIKSELQFKWAEPFKTVVVDKQRSMAVLLLRKSNSTSDQLPS